MLLQQQQQPHPTSSTYRPSRLRFQRALLRDPAAGAKKQLWRDRIPVATRKGTRGGGKWPPSKPKEPPLSSSSASSSSLARPALCESWSRGLRLDRSPRQNACVVLSACVVCVTACVCFGEMSRKEGAWIFGGSHATFQTRIV